MTKNWSAGDELPNVVAHYRHAQDWSVNELARVVDVAPSVISRIESGEHAHPRTDTLSRIAHALGIPAADLFAAAGYAVAADLPSFHRYLKTRYSELPPEARRELTQHLVRLQRRYGPQPHEDETST
jgi:transcriptional regulator with XRE-family HTH domain